MEDKATPRERTLRMKRKMYSRDRSWVKTAGQPRSEEARAGNKYPGRRIRRRTGEVEESL